LVRSGSKARAYLGGGVGSRNGPLESGFGWGAQQLAAAAAHRPGSSSSRTQFRNFSLAFACLGPWGGAPVHLKWRGDVSRLKKTCFGFGYIA
jgi:hypothetical protein